MVELKSIDLIQQDNVGIQLRNILTRQSFGRSVTESFQKKEKWKMKLTKRSTKPAYNSRFKPFARLV